MLPLFPRFLRSTPMRLYDLRVPRETAFTVVNHLGDLSLLHFLDSTPETPLYSRYYAKFIKRCEDLIQKLADLRQVMSKFGKEAKRPESVDGFLRDFRQFMRDRDKPEFSYIDEVEGQLTEIAEKMQAQQSNFEEIAHKINGLQMRRLAISHGKALRISRSPQDDLPSEYILYNWVGLLSKEDVTRFKRIVFRVSKGHSLIFIEDLPDTENPLDPKTLTSQSLSFYFLMFRDGPHETLKEKLLRVIESFGASRYDYPSDSPDLDQDSEDKAIEELTQTLNLTRSHIDEVLSLLEKPRFSSSSFFEEARLFLVREKYIYGVLNQFRQDDGDIIKVKAWCAEADEGSVREALSSLAREEKHPTVAEFLPCPESPERLGRPPSSFKTNGFLRPFQEIVNTYGIPRYREINPGLFTVITFPFLFGVMFGDVGHGLGLLGFGLFLSYYGEKLRTLAQARHLFILMGAFSIFAGLIYNEVFSIHLNLFRSCYSGNRETGVVSRKEDCVYLFGIDPIWGIATNELAFYNSFKMKLSVILGVAQMTLGITLKGANALHESNVCDFFFEFLPQVLFMACTFIYLDLLIVVKWATDWSHAGSPPSLIEQFLNLALKMGGVQGEPLYGEAGTQARVQEILFVIILISVPIMLITKPLIIYTLRKPKGQETPAKKPHSSGMEKAPQTKEPAKKDLLPEEDKNEGEDVPLISKDPQLAHILMEVRDTDSASDEPREKAEPMGEVVVHQIIETIEFVLGSISNTASYLRLWALSLAHSQLSKVFFEKTVGEQLAHNSPLGIILGFFCFANVSFAVLMCMDVMECFLHALRLHWVEFQNKFYKADGHRFEPMSYAELLTPEIEI